MIDLVTHHLITLREAAQRLPGRPSISSLVRWSRGLRDGRRLSTVKIGGRLFTSLEALQAFAAPTRGNVSMASTPMTAARHEKLARIDRQLDQEGL